jgi:molecular chaperone GrpE
VSEHRSAEGARSGANDSSVSEANRESQRQTVPTEGTVGGASDAQTGGATPGAAGEPGAGTRPASRDRARGTDVDLDHPDRVVIRDKRKIDRFGTTPAAMAEAVEAPVEDIPKAEALLLEERTADLQRLQAEYANYRRRVERDRIAVGEIAVGAVVAGLLPVLDDIDRAREHGDVTGAFKAVAEQLETVLGKLGLQPFGEVGDPFDPTIHEAVTHQESDQVREPTVTLLLRRGYRQGERLLRPAMVGVSEPASSAPPDPEPAADTHD